MNSAEFCQLDRLVVSYGKLRQSSGKLRQSSGKLRQSSGKLWQSSNKAMASSSKVQQVLARSDRLYRSLSKTAYARAHASTTKNHDYLIMRFSRYSLLFFTQRLILYKSYTLRFRQNLYHSFKSTLKSLRALTDIFLKQKPWSFFQQILFQVLFRLYPFVVIQGKRV